MFLELMVGSNAITETLFYKPLGGDCACVESLRCPLHHYLEPYLRIPKVVLLKKNIQLAIES